MYVFGDITQNSTPPTKRQKNDFRLQKLKYLQILPKVPTRGSKVRVDAYQGVTSLSEYKKHIITLNQLFITEISNITATKLSDVWFSIQSKEIIGRQIKGACSCILLCNAVIQAQITFQRNISKILQHGYNVRSK
ncbi:Hypothetical_protein [Hexamita inflata]|uniref:Hypothetical_protein n=1 Tax=Hexamita inflata TaxID=28002 RepID=A0AA86UTX1_9EUKA|nr:Hypothetical protein HINF_LOCUS37203 [Hexamita inflata]